MKILIQGNSGAGKTTLGKELASELGYSRLVLDDIAFTGIDFKLVENAILRKKVNEFITANHNHVISGNYNSQLEDMTRIDAQLIIYLVPSYFKNMSYLLRRTWLRCYYKIPVCNGNVETFKQALFTKDSILLWAHCNYHIQKKQAYDLSKSYDFK